jgi:hypothetical protein
LAELLCALNKTNELEEVRHTLYYVLLHNLRAIDSLVVTKELLAYTEAYLRPLLPCKELTRILKLSLFAPLNLNQLHF